MCNKTTVILPEKKDLLLLSGKFVVKIERHKQKKRDFSFARI